MADEDKKVNKSSLSFARKDKEKSSPNVNDSKTARRSNMALVRPSRSNVALTKTSRSNMALHKSCSRMKMRRHSYGFGGVPGIRALDKASQNAADYKRPPLSYLPTYQLEPKSTFHLQNVIDLAEALLDHLFTGHKYSIAESPPLAIRIAAYMMRQVKYMDLNRYRIIAVATIGQKRAQSYNNAVTFLWDRDRDHYMDVHRENVSCFVQLTLFLIYLD